MFSLRFIVVILSLFLSLSAVAQNRISDIVVEKNQRVSTNTILSYLALTKGQAFDTALLNKSIKNLYLTGLFSDIKLYREGSKLVVSVDENPIINSISYEGNKHLKDKAITSESSLKERDVYTRSKLTRDAKRIQDLYYKTGRYSAVVTPKVVPLDQNRVDVVYEITEGEKATITDIHFVGNHVFTNGELRDVINSRETRWYRFFSNRDTFDKDRVAYDNELLRNHYISKGYADFKVTSSVAEITDNQHDFVLTFNIEEGEKYQFGAVDIAAEIENVETESLETHVKTISGKTFNANLVEDTISSITAKLNNEGFAFVEVKPQFKRDPKARKIDLVYAINEGPTVYIGRINIDGNVRTLDRVVRREMRIAEGDAYDAEKIRRSTQRIRNLGFFEKVEVTTVPSVTSEDRADINIVVTEKSTGEINFGAGFSTTDGALGNISVQERNLLGKGQNLRVSLQKSARSTQFDIGFTEPYFMGRDLAAGFDLFNTSRTFESESGFDSSTFGGRLRAGYSLTEHFRHNFYYSYRDTTIEDIQPNASAFVVNQQGSNLNSSIGQGLVYDRRDNRFEPTDGYVLSLNQEFAGVGGDSEYLKHEVSASHYWPFFSDNIVASLTGKAGHIFGYSGKDVRINERFFIGGNSMRGFDVAGIGPRDSGPNRDALGGNTYYTGTAEALFPLGLPKELGIKGALFVDVGSLYDTDDSGPTVQDSDSLRGAYGFGIYWKSPLGPIRIDIANAFLKESFDEEENFRLNFGTRF